MTTTATAPQLTTCTEAGCGSEYMAACDDHGHDGSDQKTANPLWARYAALRGDA